MDARAAFVAFPADLDEFLESALKPCRPHGAAAVPDRAEAVPLARVAPQNPVLDQFADRKPVGGGAGHVRLMSSPGLTRRSRLGEQCAYPSAMAGTSPAMTNERCFMSRLAGKVAIVTGGAKGIGRHYSRALAA